MSNIYTEFARLYFRPGATMSEVQAEELLELILDERGSYWVPVDYELDWPNYVDYQYGSGKGAGLHNLEKEHLAPFEELWIRFANEGSDYDTIYRWSPASGDTCHDGYPRHRLCRYGFDEIEIYLAKKKREAWIPAGLPWKITPDGYRASVVGTYLTLNERSDMDNGARVRLQKPRKPANSFSSSNTRCYDLQISTLPTVQADLVKLVEFAQIGIERIEFRYWGRPVHLMQWGPHHHDEKEMVWQHRSGDGWANCLDEEFVALRKTWV